MTGAGNVAHRGQIKHTKPNRHPALSCASVRLQLPRTNTDAEDDAETNSTMMMMVMMMML